MTQLVRRRPLGATVLALLLGWLGVAAFGNAIALRSASKMSGVPQGSGMAHFLVAASSPLFGVLLLAYGASALIACVGIWRLHSWMSQAYIAWLVAVAAFVIWLSLATPLFGGLASLPFFAGSVAFLALCVPYLRRLGADSSA